MRHRCAVLDDYQGVALAMADWSSLAAEVDVRVYRERFETPEKLIDAVHDCDIIVAMRERTPFSDDVIARLPNLRLLVSTGMRNASIDLDAARDHGVTVCGTASQSEPPAELTWALILGLAKHVMVEAQAMRTDGPWQQTIGIDLCGKTLGLLGLGKIGAKVARIGQAFDMRVMAWSQNLTRERCDQLGVEYARTKEALLEASDIVSIHLQLSDRTRGLVTKEDLRRMKSTAFLINTSRAPIVDGAGLMEALQAGWIGGAGLDVYEEEPLPDGHPLRQMPNVLAMPHVGYVTEANYRTYYGEAVEDIAAFLAGAPIRVMS
ncbi:D-2-hydroxyacid dehydrogenase family protein [Alicyclobacillus acidiphilus]|uniref:D-2-hydroxyacid dehydrogenase family protein n=1 Tax=Alicyclobacillus acidiphilus TaxID=182455 RepID=UPI000830D11A|nr:D-2-hydroxyacid dehydrogenase family protein [Alicyclobacillus acidiphilus]